MNARRRSILIVEDDRAAAIYMAEALAGQHGDIRTAAAAVEGLLAMESRPPDLLILDLGLPDIGGLEVLTRVRERWPEVRVICVTAADDVPTVVEAVQRGASNYLVKPVVPAVLLAAAGKALSAARTAPGPASGDLSGIVGVSRAMLMVRHLVALAGRSDVNVLITGETGTGKELIARAIHRLGGHDAEAFLAFNCATTPTELFDSAFFGHRRGAFTGADQDHLGLLRRADGRTLLLDELDSLGPQQQAKLLRVLDDGEVRPVGSSEVYRVSVRFLAATNSEPGTLIDRRLLREDLYYRLRGFEIHVSPLRERVVDIPVLAAHFLSEAAPRLTGESLAILSAYAWPGNARELRNVLKGALILAGDGPIRPEHLPIATGIGPLRGARSPRSRTWRARPPSGRSRTRGSAGPSGKRGAAAGSPLGSWESTGPRCDGRSGTSPCHAKATLASAGPPSWGRGGARPRIRSDDRSALPAR